MPYNAQKALSFAQGKSGRYRDGECWTLVEDAVVGAGGTSSTKLTPNFSPAASFVWGTPVQVNQLKPGDVLQFSGYAWLQEVTTETVFSHPEPPDPEKKFDGNVNAKEVTTTVDQKRGEPQHTAIVTNVISPGLVEVIEQNIPSVIGEVQTFTLALIARQFPVTTEVTKYRTNINGKDVDATQTIKKTTKETVSHPPRCYRPK